MAERKPRVVTYVATKPKVAELRAVRSFIVDRVVRWAREMDHCDEVEGGLEAVFGAKPKDGWRDSDGYNCYGFNVLGFNEEGFDEEGFDAAGFNDHGYNLAGYNKDGFDYSGYTQAGYNKDGWDRNGYNSQGVDAAGRKKGELQTLVDGLTQDRRLELFTILRNYRG